MLTVALLSLFLIVASFTDIRWRKIFNWTTYPGTLLAWGLNAAGTVLLRLGWANPADLERLGYIGLGPSLLGFVLCGGLLVLCYVFFDIGGGDVKLLAMVGAYLGPEKGLEALLWTLVLGGCLALIVAIWHFGAWKLVRHLVVAFWHWIRWRHWLGLLPRGSGPVPVPMFLAPCALVAVLVVAVAGGD
jgi:prepilin peptidase CpaA